MFTLRLEELLDKKGLSKRAFAKLLKIQYPHVFRFFRPGYDPKLSMLLRWSEALKCDIEELFKKT
jgi:transcriptional regulator with XRE-family HTH domain